MTGYGDEQTQRRSRDAGIYYHLVKPVSPDELCALLDTVAAGPGMRYCQSHH